MPSLDELCGDVLIVGGGPAGLATAIALRMRGLRVCVADARTPPIDQACGEGILPGGVEALSLLGVALVPDEGFAFRGIRFLEDGVTLEALFASAAGMAIRRTHLHALLTARALECGAELVWGVHVPDVSGVRGFEWIVGADGRQSRVRRDVGLGPTRPPTQRFGFRRHYRMAPWTDLVEVYWSGRYQLYVTPVSASEIGVALLTRDRGVRLDAALAGLPALNRRLRGASQVGADRGASTMNCRLPRVYRGRTALLGDASGSVDAITGEGLSLAFQQAHALAEAIEAGDLRLYQRKHRDLSRHAEQMARLLLLLERFPRLRRTIWRALALVPSQRRRPSSAESGSPAAGPCQTLPPKVVI